MSDVSRDACSEALVEAVGEVHLEVSHERLKSTLSFYQNLIGLPLWPPERQVPGGCGLGNWRRGVWMRLRHDPEIDPVRRRLLLRVFSLNAVATRFDESGVAYLRYRGFGFEPDYILVNDPVGNLIEIRPQRVF